MRKEGTDSLQMCPTGGTPSSSHRQELERQQSIEVSSLKSSSTKIIDIKGKFKEIKAKNEQLKAQAYAQYLKMAPSNQTRLMSAFAIKEGKMQMSFLKPTVLQPKSLADYLKTDFEVMAKDIHPIDQIELHKQTGEMVYSTLSSKAMMAHRLQNSLSNTTAQLQLEMASSQAKDNRIKSLEDFVIKVGYDPKDVKVAELLLKKKDADIAALKKQLKLPSIEDPLTKDMAENEQ